MGISCFGFSTLQGQAGKGHLNPFESVKPAYELMDDIINLSSEPIYRKKIKKLLHFYSARSVFKADTRGPLKSQVSLLRALLLWHLVFYFSLLQAHQILEGAIKIQKIFFKARQKLILVKYSS